MLHATQRHTASFALCQPRHTPRQTPCFKTLHATQRHAAHYATSPRTLRATTTAIHDVARYARPCCTLRGTPTTAHDTPRDTPHVTPRYTTFNATLQHSARNATRRCTPHHVAPYTAIHAKQPFTRRDPTRYVTLYDTRHAEYQAKPHTTPSGAMRYTTPHERDTA